VPRSRVCRKTGPRGRRAQEAWRCPSGSGLACRPNLAGWAYWTCSRTTSGARPIRPQNDPSMLLSFERPASAGIAYPVGARWIRRIWRDQQTRPWPALYASPRSLKTAQKPQSAAIDKRRLKNGYHRALQDLGAPQGAIRLRWARSPSR
jgi:hypothetical protein